MYVCLVWLRCTSRLVRYIPLFFYYFFLLYPTGVKYVAEYMIVIKGNLYFSLKSAFAFFSVLFCLFPSRGMYVNQPGQESVIPIRLNIRTPKTKWSLIGWVLRGGGCEKFYRSPWREFKWRKMRKLNYWIEICVLAEVDWGIEQKKKKLQTDKTIDDWQVI